MYKKICPNCGQVSYSSCKEDCRVKKWECPYCGYDLSDVKEEDIKHEEKEVTS